MAEDNKLFDAPIPGQSLTAEVGARPWQQPAQYTTVEDAFEFYATKITDPELIAYVAESSSIEYNMGIEKQIDQDKIPESKIELAAKRIKDKMPKETTEEMPMVEPETMPEESPQEGGIMSRRI